MTVLSPFKPRRTQAPASSRRPVAGAALAAALLATGAVAHAAPAMSDHAAAMAALSDLRTAIATIVAAEDSYATGPAAYREAGEHAINVLVGTRAKQFDATAAQPSDALGALGRIDGLLDRTGTPRWSNAMHSAEANIRAAVARLQEANTARELMEHQIAVSAALENLLVAEGSASDPGVFGGLAGALANTDLGVPDGGRTADACAANAPEPGQDQGGPVFGTHAGYLAYVALPLAEGTQQLPGPLDITGLTVQGKTLLVRTPAAPVVAKLCAAGTSQGNDKDNTPGTATTPPPSAAPAAPANPHPALATPSTPLPDPASNAPAAKATLPALYTAAQAKAGKEIYTDQCASCHGPTLQGTAAPSVAGRDFLSTAKLNGWTLEVIRYLIFSMMPLNNPRSLAPAQYADVTAYLLAANCFPAGNKPFPERDDSSFATIQLGPLPGHYPGENALDVCPVP